MKVVDLVFIVAFLRASSYLTMILRISLVHHIDSGNVHLLETNMILRWNQIALIVAWELMKIVI